VATCPIAGRPPRVADEVDFAWPTGPGAGRFSGTEGRTLMDKSFRAFGGELRATGIRRTATTVAGDTVIFEDDGLIVGYREHVAREPPAS
jgi:hypothetical protein